MDFLAQSRELKSLIYTAATIDIFAESESIYVYEDSYFKFPKYFPFSRSCQCLFLSIRCCLMSIKNGYKL